MKRILLAVPVLLVGAAMMHADTLVTTRPTGTDSVNWGQLPPWHTAIPNPFSFTTTNGVDGTGSYANPSNSAYQVIQDSTWDGVFSHGDVLNWSDGAAALTLDFDSGFTQIGAQIQAQAFGAFTAEICDDNDSVCFSENGISDIPGDRVSAIYIGIESATPITEVTFSLTYPVDTSNSFAINEVTLGGGSGVSAVPAPEGGSSFAFLLMSGACLCGTALFRFRKRPEPLTA
jgi:hypothetical protein